MRGCQPPAKRSGLTVTLTFGATNDSKLNIKYWTMNKKQFTESLKGKTVSELLALLEQVQSGQIKLDPDNINSIIEELNTRQLSKAEESEFRILFYSFSHDSVETEEEDAEKNNPSSSKKRAGKSENKVNEANKNYKVVPFNPSDNVPRSLQSIIDSESINGWEYVNHQYSDKLKPGSAGCFGIGATSDSTTHIGVVVFKKNN
jgi:hypothetical protein